MPPTRVFLSHSTQDNPWCRVLVDALKAAQYDVWYDEQGLTGGAEWVATLQREVQSRDVFIVVITPEAWASPWVQEEVRLALATRRTILPVMLKPSSVEGFLLTRQWVDVSGVDAPTGAQRVLAALGSPVVFAAPAAPKQVAAAPQIVWPTLQQRGFVGRVMDGVAVITPPLCPVPAGPFWMGTDPTSEPEAAENEQAQRSVEVAAFYIGQYPVTVAEYGCALQAQAFAPPRDWARQAARPDHPVAQLSWRNAVAYAAWVAQVTGEAWRVPTEEEWEKAARGVDGRSYPWGNAWDRARANTQDGGPGDTTPVGAYPGGASPCGALDMAGNVNEWCGIPPGSPLLRPDPQGFGPQESKGYLSGGSWDDSPTLARCAHRSQLFVGERSEDTGMRLVFQAAG
ncbi:MAG TPA: SUMF1/EgtB/PvdO family nonheme iron enzyme [Ktedonobacterales bacterium]